MDCPDTRCARAIVAGANNYAGAGQDRKNRLPRIRRVRTTEDLTAAGGVRNPADIPTLYGWAASTMMRPRPRLIR